MKKHFEKFLQTTRLNRMVTRWEVLVVLLLVIAFRSCVGV